MFDIVYFLLDAYKAFEIGAAKKQRKPTIKNHKKTTNNIITWTTKEDANFLFGMCLAQIVKDHIPIRST